MRYVGLGLMLIGVVAACGDAHTRAPEPLPELIEHDQDCDGTTDRCERFVDADGGTRFGIDHECDGTLDEGCTLQRSDGRSLLTDISDSDCDGMPDGSGCFRTDDLGGGRSLFRFDADCDGVWDRCEHHNARVGDRQTWTIDEGCDDTLEVCVTVTHGPNSYRRIETDEGCDGTIDEIECGVREPIVDDGIMHSSEDRDCDGVADAVCSDKTLLHGVEIADLRDGDCDGTPDLCRSAVTVADGTVLSGFDHDCDGTPDSGCTGHAFEAGQPSGQFDDVDCDGEANEQCLMTGRDAAGRRLNASFDLDCDGSPDWCDTWSY